MVLTTLFGGARETRELTDGTYIIGRAESCRVRFDAPEDMELTAGTLVMANYEHNFVISNGFTARPYELRVYLFD